MAIWILRCRKLIMMNLVRLYQNFEDMRIRLKESAEEKIQFDKENKELISNISHDLKTPVTSD